VVRRDGGPGRWRLSVLGASRPLVVWAMRLSRCWLSASVWRSSSGGLSSSSLERPVFAPPIALTAFSLRLGRRSSGLGWVLLCGLCSCCSGFSPVFR
jgi:hypothetical protein